MGDVPTAALSRSEPGVEGVAPADYPVWKYYPSRARPPSWVAEITDVFDTHRADLDSREREGITSDSALATLRPGLVDLGFEVESGKRRIDKIRRPVLFGEILRRVIELLPKISPGQRDYLQGVATGLELKRSRRSRLVGEARPAESTSATDSAERD